MINVKIFARAISGAAIACTNTSCTVLCDPLDSDIRSNRFGQWPAWSRKWVNDWDHRHPAENSETSISKNSQKKTLHLIMIRHGQYDMKGDKGLTSLGREQADLTGKRIEDLGKSAIDDFYGKRKIRISRLYHSDVKRAQETAAIIASHLDPNVAIVEDPMLAEGWPCVPDPYKNVSEIRPSSVFAESARIEAAFRKYCHRVTDFKQDGTSETDKREQTKSGPKESNDTTEDETEEEYVIIVCHQNVIRYFVCRALQLPPEAWLRFRGSNCGITEIIISDDGKVSLEKFADVGHLPVNNHTFH